MSDMALKNAKTILRKEMKSRLRTLSAAEKQRQSAVVTKMVCRFSLNVIRKPEVNWAILGEYSSKTPYHSHRYT